MQTILGSTGSIGKLLAKDLIQYTNNIRLVSRNPFKINPTDKIVSADLLNFESTLNAVSGSEIVYLTAGLKYETKIWQRDWPIVMQNVINACIKQNAKLVFFDNIYMIDKNHIGHITEQSPINPISQKGKVRAELNLMLMDEIQKGNLRAVIARAADFYGPTDLSVITSAVFQRLKSGKSAQWFINLDHKHSFTFTPDGAKAMAILGNSDKADNQVWNIPTNRNTMNGKEWINEFAKILKIEPKIQLVGKNMVKILGVFVPFLREFNEMSYQWESEYFLDSSKFENEFNFNPTSYLSGIESYFN